MSTQKSNKNQSNKSQSTKNQSDKAPTKAQQKAIQKEKEKKKKRRRQLVATVFLAILIIGYLGGLQFENTIDQALGLMEIERYEAGDKVEVGKLSVHFMDVGQGDACLIELPDNKTMLIDAGENKTEVKNKLDSYISDVNTVRADNGRGEIEKFDYAIATHSDSDHIGSMKYIIDKIPATTFYRPNEQATYTGYTDPALTKSGNQGFWGVQGQKDTLTYKNTIESAYNKCDNVIVTNPNDPTNTQNIIKPALNSTHEDYYEINFYGHSSSSYSDHNNYSPVIIIEYKSRRIALSGDCEKEGEGEFVTLANEGNGRYSIFTSTFTVDAIKLGHHGSRTSSTEGYLTVLTPQTSDRQSVFLIISCGEGNSYNHPHTEVLERAETMGFAQENFLRTDLVSDIVIDLILMEGDQNAICSVGGLVVPRVIYHYNVAGIQIRFRTVGLVIIVIFGLILVPLTFLSTKNKNKIIKEIKNKAQNIKK